MTDDLYVATDAHGIQHEGVVELAWTLPDGQGTSSQTLAPPGGALVLRTTAGLLEALDERIFAALPESGGAAATDTAGSGSVSVPSARLTAETAWGVGGAARFAIDCAEHVLGDAGPAALPGGGTLAEVLQDARSLLVRFEASPEQRVGRVARLVAARRLRRQGGEVADAALRTLVDDEADDLDTLDDPSWTAIASARDAVLAAVEAVRHLALPRYLSARESAYDDSHKRASDIRSTAADVIVTPFGPIVVGAEHLSGFVPAWVAATDAARRAQESARGKGGTQAEQVEREWQATCLAAYLRDS